MGIQGCVIGVYSDDFGIAAENEECMEVIFQVMDDLAWCLGLVFERNKDLNYYYYYVICHLAKVA